MRLMLATGLCLLVACGGEEETIVVDSRGRIEALINLTVEDVGETLSVSTPAGQSVFLMEHRGVLTIDDVDYGVAGENHLLGLALDRSLVVQWVRDYGPVFDLTLAGGVWREPRAVVLIASGELTTSSAVVTGPAFLPIAFADGVALPALPLSSEEGALLPRSVRGSGEVTAVAGTLTRNVDGDGLPLPAPRQEAWVRRYEGELGGAPVWDRAFAAESGDASLRSAAVDSVGNVVVEGLSYGTLPGLSISAGAFLAKLGATAGDPLWVRERFDDPTSIPLAIDAADNVLVNTVALERGETAANAPELYALNGTNGATSYSRVLVSDDTDFFAPRFLCAGRDDDAYAVVGEFTGTLRTANSVATVVNNSVFVLKSENDGGAALFLRWSESSVDVNTEYGSCDDAGGIVLGGRFDRVDGSTGETTRLLYFLRLSS